MLRPADVRISVDLGYVWLLNVVLGVGRDCVPRVGPYAVCDLNCDDKNKVIVAYLHVWNC